MVKTTSDNVKASTITLHITPPILRATVTVLPTVFVLSFSSVGVLQSIHHYRSLQYKISKAANLTLSLEPTECCIFSCSVVL